MMKGENMSHKRISGLKRREFLKASVLGLAVWPKLKFEMFTEESRDMKTKVALIKTADRKAGVREAFKLLTFPSPKGKKVLIKPNFNTSDPTPGSTHNDTLTQIIQELKNQGAAGITIGERSGPPPTQKVMEDKGIFALSKELGFEIINFENLAAEGWAHFNPEGNHWEGGFDIAKPIVDAEYLVSTCCLKTHQYGGVFTMSLKLAVGTTPKTLMRQLHRSANQRKMIAELNLAFKPQLIILDGVEAFVDGGPSQGKKVQADVFIAGTDRIAVDAVGLAVLKELGSNAYIMDTAIFEQEQIARAVELGLGISRPDQIDLVASDEPSKNYVEKIKPILAKG
jgi:uncharacterized protein (DUF362 family)